MKKYLIIVLLLVFAFPGISNAQKVGLKTNALYWATTTPNLGLEVGMGDRFSFYLEGGYNPWTFNKENNSKMKHYLISPEGRYWFCEVFQGHFVGLNANYAQYNAGGFHIPNLFIPLSSDAQGQTDLLNSRIEGWAAGAGLTYGYAFPFARRWNLELTLGLGWWYTNYDQFESRKCGLFQQTVQKHVLGPTALGATFVYMIK